MLGGDGIAWLVIGLALILLVLVTALLRTVVQVRQHIDEQVRQQRQQRAQRRGNPPRSSTPRQPPPE